MEGRKDTAKGPIFVLDIGGEGAGRLREVVKTKLSDFMGTYTDDVLAEYVVVLVGHGKHQAQAAKDLEAFLGDQSDKFVSWLWEHVNSHIHLYISGTKISQLGTDLVDNDAIEATTTEKQMSSFDEQKLTASDDGHHTASEKEIPRDYVIKSSVVKAGSDSDDTLSATIGASCRQDIKWTAKRPWSPSNMDLIKEQQSDERRQRKRFSYVPNTHAPRRLLQSAVRDAVAPSLRPSQPRRADPSTKRLRSVVSADIDDESKIFEHSESEVGTAMAVATKESSGIMSTDREGETQMGSVWDRLRKGPTRYVGVPKIVGSTKAGDKNSGKGFNFEDALQQETDRDRVSMEKRGKSRSVLDRISRSFREDDNTCLEGHMFSSEGGGEESEFCENASFNGPFNTIGNERLEPASREESVTVQYRLAQSMEKTKDNGDMDRTSVVDPTNPQKIVSISVNVNTWKHPTLNEQARLTSVSNHYQDHQKDKEKNTEFPKPFDAKETELQINSIQDVSKMKERIQQVEMEMAKLKAKQAEVTNEVHKAAISGGSLAQRSEDDINEHMIFVSNVHFAATKETLAAHFSRCGEIVRVLLLTDETNGQPKGSAYLEFSSKDGAEKALSLNESSFLSRVLKVVRKDATVTEAISPMMVRSPIPRRVTPPIPMRAPPRPRFLRGSPYLAPRFPATPWPPSYGRPTNMQWKRDSPSANQPSSHIRSFSYIRSTSEAQEQKEPAKL